MKRLLICVVVFLSFTHFQVISQEAMATKKMNLTDFFHIIVSGDLDVEFMIGKDPWVEVIAPESDIDKVVIDFDRGGLILSLSEPAKSKTPIKVRVHSRRLTKMKIAGDARFTTPKPLELNGLLMDISGNAEVDMTVIAIQVSVNLASGARVRLKGASSALIGFMQGSAKLDALEMNAQQGDLNLKEKAEAKVVVRQKLVAEVTGKAKLYYKGEPKLVKGDSVEGSVVRLEE